VHVIQGDNQMFNVNGREVFKLEKELGVFNKKALPFANRAALTTGAFKAREFAQDNIRNKMITRNKWTLGSVIVDKAKGTDIHNQTAEVGSTEDYMEVQEFGGTKRRKGSEGIPLTTTYASGEGEGSTKRSRLARGGNKLKKIRLTRKRNRGVGRVQKNIVAIKEAAQSGNKFVFLEMKRKKGIFKVVGGKKNPKIKMVHDLTEQTVDIPASPWLLPAVNKTIPMMGDIYSDALQFQLKRLDLFK